MENEGDTHRTKIVAMTNQRIVRGEFRTDIVVMEKIVGKRRFAGVGTRGFKLERCVSPSE
jgi:hypothetical protein